MILALVALVALPAGMYRQVGGGSAASAVAQPHVEGAALSGNSTWTALVPSTATGHPPPGYGESMAYDAADGYTLLFDNGSGVHGGTWALEGGAWVLLHPTASPPALSGAEMTYDSADRAVLLVGDGLNYCGYGQCLETWAFRGGNWTPAASPASYVNATGIVLADDPSDGGIVMVGQTAGELNCGASLGGIIPQPVTYTYVSGTWTRLRMGGCLQTGMPTLRASAQMAFDPYESRVILFGGQAGTYYPQSSRAFNDTWAYHQGEWTELNPSMSPPARSNGELVYDAALQAPILFGGRASNGSALNDTWAWEGGNWVELPSSAAPGARWAFGMAFDQRAEELAVFGGTAGSGAGFGDTWMMSPTAPRSAPTAEWSHLSSGIAAPGAPYSPTLYPGGVCSTCNVSSVRVGVGPTGAMYDPSNRRVYVANEQSDSVSVISDANNTVVATVPVGTHPFELAYVATSGEIYVTNDGSASVSVISDTTNAVVATIPVGPNPWGLAYDRATGNLYVADEGSWNTTVISAATHSVVATINDSVIYPKGVAWDSGNGYVYVAGGPLNDPGSVSVIDPTTDQVVATVPVGGQPNDLAYDSQDGRLYVANYGNLGADGDTVSVISDATNSLVATIPVGAQPSSVVFDSANDNLYVSNSGSNNVSVILGSTGSVVGSLPVGAYPWEMAWDRANGYLFVTDYLSNNVTVLAPYGAIPTARWGAASAYDPRTASVLVFGGSSIVWPALSNDTWSFAAGHWTNLTSTLGTAPPPRVYASAAYDPSVGGILLFGGYGTSGYALNDTWAFSNGTWQNLTSLLSASPPPRAHAAMAYDPAAQETILFGGSSSASGYSGGLPPPFTDEPGPFYSDTWAYANGTWSQLHPVTSPPARSGSQLTFDAADGYLVLFGGNASAPVYGRPLLNDTWEFADGNWSRIETGASPAPRDDSGLAYDPAVGAVVLFGGYTGGSCTSYDANDTWAYSGGFWRSVPAGGGPSPRQAMGFAYDPAIGAILVIDGFSDYCLTGYPALSDVWSLSYGGGPSPPGPYRGTVIWGPQASGLPTGRLGASSAYDMADGYLVVVGGQDAMGQKPGDTWAYEAGNWTNLTGLSSPGPSARSFAAMAYDAVDQGVLLFGGSGLVDYLNDTWEFSHGTWVNLTPSLSLSPPARAFAAMTYDPVDREVVLFGGRSNSGGGFSDTWVFQGGRWTELSPSISPPARAVASLVFDEADGYAVLYGGKPDANFGYVMGDTDTWAFAGGNWWPLPSSSNPGPRDDYGITYDRATAQVVLYGGWTVGNGCGSPNSDVWVFAGGQWASTPSVGAPTGRQGMVFAYDPSEGGSQGSILMAGGDTGTCGVPTSARIPSDLWSLQPPPPSFSLILAPPIPSTVHGDLGPIGFNVTAVGSFGFSAAIGLALECTRGCYYFTVAFEATGSGAATVASGGSASFQVTFPNASRVAPAGGLYEFQIVGTSGTESVAANGSFVVRPPPANFALQMSPSNLTIPFLSTAPAGFAVTATGSNGFNQSVHLTVACLAGCLRYAVRFAYTNASNLSVAPGQSVGIVVFPSPTSSPIAGVVYRFAVNGTSGELWRQANASFTVASIVGMSSRLDLNGIAGTNLQNRSQALCSLIGWSGGAATNQSASCFSIQQNVILAVQPRSPGPFDYYWIQNGIVETTLAPSGLSYGGSFFGVYALSSNGSRPILTPLYTPNASCACAPSSLNGSRTFHTAILQGEIVATNSFGSFDYLLPDGGNTSRSFLITTLPWNASLANASELLLVGPPDAGEADFLNTGAWAATLSSSFALLSENETGGSQSAVYGGAVQQSPAYAGQTLAPETSTGLTLSAAANGTTTLTGVTGGCFAANQSTCNIEGVFLQPTVSTTVNGGVAFQFDRLAANTSIGVLIYHSTASNGTNVTVTSSSVARLLNGTAWLNASSLVLYDVRVDGISSGTARVCVTYLGVAPSSALVYYNGTAWVNATNRTVNGTVICGDIPVAALSGSLVSIVGTFGFSRFTASATGTTIVGTTIALNAFAIDPTGASPSYRFSTDAGRSWSAWGACGSYSWATGSARLGLHQVRAEARNARGVVVASLPIAVWLAYHFSGFLAPTPNQEVSRGAPVLVRFQLTDASGAFRNHAVAQLWVGGRPATPSATGFSGNSFVNRGNVYSYRLATASLLPGGYELQATLDDGTSHGVNIALVTELETSRAGGPVGTVLSARGIGFPYGDLVVLSVGSALVSQYLACSAGVANGGEISPDAAQAFACTFAVPTGLPNGPQPVEARDLSRPTTVSVAFQVTTPAISILPASGPRGSSFLLTGSGFGYGGTVSLTLGANAVSAASCALGSIAGGRVVADPTGHFACILRVLKALPDGAATLVATDRGSLATASGSYIVTTPTLVLTVSRGPVGEPVTAMGTGFPASGVETIAFGSAGAVPILSCTTGADLGSTILATTGGSFACTFVVPAHASPGPRKVQATEPLSGASASAPFRVTVPDLTVTPGSGTAGAPVEVSGDGFTPGGALKLGFGGIGPLVPSSCGTGAISGSSVIASPSGSWDCRVAVPFGLSPGASTITGTDLASGATANVLFRITSLVLSVSSGPVRTIVTVIGAGFDPSARISLELGSEPIGACSAGSLATDTHGGFHCTFVLSTRTSPGTYGLEAESSGRVEGTVAFVVT